MMDQIIANILFQFCGGLVGLGGGVSLASWAGGFCCGGLGGGDTSVLVSKNFGFLNPPRPPAPTPLPTTTLTLLHLA